jgi:hypothetical protein
MLVGGPPEIVIGEWHRHGLTSYPDERIMVAGICLPNSPSWCPAAE